MKENLTVSKTVLAVDDSVSNLVLLDKILRKAGYYVSVASSGEKALNIMKDTFVDLVLLDIEMPDMSGFQVFQKMKEDPDISDIPVIFVTADRDISSVKEAMSLGAEGYIVKPYDISELGRKIFKVIKEEKTNSAAEYLEKKFRLITDSIGRNDPEGIEQIKTIPLDKFNKLLVIEIKRLQVCLSNRNFDEALKLMENIRARFYE